MASDICSIARLGFPNDRELEEGRGFEDDRDMWEGFSSFEREYDGLDGVTFTHSSLGVTSSMTVNSKNLIN